MTLIDAGPLIALIDADDPDHARCVETLNHVRLPLVTTWPAFTEAMYLLGRASDWRAQNALWRLVQRQDLLIPDRPMDLAAATLVALAEERDDNRIFTLDGDFHVYRFRGRRRFDVIPA